MKKILYIVTVVAGTLYGSESSHRILHSSGDFITAIAAGCGGFDTPENRIVGIAAYLRFGQSPQKERRGSVPQGSKGIPSRFLDFEQLAGLVGMDPSEFPLEALTTENVQEVKDPNPDKLPEENLRKRKESLSASDEAEKKDIASDGVVSKRKYVRQKPRRNQYKTDKDFDAAWEKWREKRDRNNEAVNKSRGQTRL